MGNIGYVWIYSGYHVLCVIPISYPVISIYILGIIVSSNIHICLRYPLVDIPICYSVISLHVLVSILFSNIHIHLIYPCSYPIMLPCYILSYPWYLCCCVLSYPYIKHIFFFAQRLARLNMIILSYPTTYIISYNILIVILFGYHRI